MQATERRGTEGDLLWPLAYQRTAEIKRPVRSDSLAEARGLHCLN
jgi:hypothetical protein